MQSNVCISTRESDLNVVYGMINFGSERDLARTSLKYILTDMNSIRSDFIRLGFHLWEFERMKYYQDFGYASIAEFADANLGLDGSAVSRYISVFREFAMRDNKGSLKMFLDERYKDYSFSQLSEMVSMKPDKRKLVRADMTVREIRELKKNVSRNSENVSQIATSQRKILDKRKYDSLSGSARSKYVKSRELLRGVVLQVYDANGVSVPGFSNIWVDLLYSDSDDVIVRLFGKAEDLEVNYE